MVPVTLFPAVGCSVAMAFNDAVPVFAVGVYASAIKPAKARNISAMREDLKVLISTVNISQPPVSPDGLN